MRKKQMRGLDPSGAVRSLTGVIVVAALLATLVIACGQGQTAEPVSDNSTVSQGDSGATQGTAGEDDVEIAASLGYSADNSDIYQNLTPEQRAQLAPGLTPEQLMALTSEQLAALSQVQNAQQANAANSNAPAPTDAEATAVNTTLGQLNMEQITEAFELSENIDDFEEKINEIYEGPHTLLVKARNVGDQSVTEAWEDLDDTGEIADAVDDLLFSFFVQRDTRAARLVGQGTNNHFVREFPPTHPNIHGFWRDFILANLNRPEWRYVTPAARRAIIRTAIQTHRATPDWRAQQRANREYYRRLYQNPLYTKAIVNVSPARRHWRSQHPVAVPLPPPPARMKIRRHHPRRVKAGYAPPPPPGVKRGYPAPPPPPGVKVGVPPRPGVPGVQVNIGAPPPPPSVQINIGAPPPPPHGVKVGAPPPPPGVKVGAPPPPPGVKIGAPPPRPHGPTKVGPPPPPVPPRGPTKAGPPPPPRGPSKGHHPTPPPHGKAKGHHPPPPPGPTKKRR